MPIDFDDTQLFLRSDDGVLIPFNGIGTAELCTTDTTYAGITAEDLRAPMEFSCTIKMKNGAMDILIGRWWTKAAQRVIRLEKRHKEKLRRKKLKEEQGHEHADMGRTRG